MYDSVVRSTCCSSRGPGTDSKHLHGGSQQPGTPVLADQHPPLAFMSTCTHVVHV